MSVDYSQFTFNLKELQRRVPVVADKALIDLVNGIQVNKDLIRYRKNRGFFGQLLDTLDGSDRKRQLLLDGNLIAGQEALHQWVLELSDSLYISQVALKVTQQSLLEARDAIRRQKKSLQMQEEALLALTQGLDRLAQQVGTRLNELEARVQKLEVRVAANEDLDRIVTAWAAEQTYTKLPWAVQVALLAREVFSSSVATYELETGDTTRYRSLLVNKILSTSKQLPQSFFGLADLLDYSWKPMVDSDRQLSAALLEVRSIPQQRLQNTPLLFALGTTLELATLPEEARPSKPGQSAIALCRAQIGSVSRTTDAREFITTVIEETASDCIAMIERT
ncbi:MULTISPECIES: YjcZ-like family protein [unclassified Coleofasciculus]|uniref:YjcZ-like family protein n=1 Tax=unclassified Coleofasciculus TaxID=2692782 RepID=UPI001D139D72|nr:MULTISPECIES: YjcZ-like family protein [unclassified Coleofasciculus]